MIKHRCRHTGFTLIEIVVVLAISVIVLAAVFSLLLFGNRMTSKTSAKRDIQAQMRIALDSVVNQVRNAESISLSSGDSSMNRLYVSSGKLFLWDADAASTVELTDAVFTGTDANLFSLELSGSVNSLRVIMNGKDGKSEYAVETKLVLSNIRKLPAAGPSSSLYFTKPVVTPAVLPAMTGTVTITGTPKSGETLTAGLVLIHAGTPVVKWLRDGVSIGSAIDLTYILTDADIGKAITVSVSADDISGTGTIVSSPVTVWSAGMPVLGGSVGIDGILTFSQLLTANTAGLVYTPNTAADVRTYAWFREGVAIPGATANSYTITEDDIGKLLSVRVSADGTHAIGSVESSAGTVVQKMAGPAAPGAPVLASKRYDRVILVGNAAMQYSSDGGTTWQGDSSFLGLNYNTGYSFSQRYKASTTQQASDPGAALSVTTDGLPVLSGTLAIDGERKYAKVLTANLAGLVHTPSYGEDLPLYQWLRNGAAISGANMSSYTLEEADIDKSIELNVTADNIHAVGTVTASAGTIQKADGPAAPAAPELASKTSSSVTLAANAGYEYRLSSTGLWQISPVFSGLNNNTSYTFFCRVAATTTTKASAASPGNSIKTANKP